MVITSAFVHEKAYQTPRVYQSELITVCGGEMVQAAMEDPLLSLQEKLPQSVWAKFRKVKCNLEWDDASRLT